MWRYWLFVIGILLSNPVWAFRCGHSLVQIGHHKLDVLEKCGEPDAMEERIAVRGSRLGHPYGALQIDHYEEILIEEWVYNFGPRQFKQFLHFEDGVLTAIRKLSYGF
jgi:hypothetical protein